jgi:hypothetical protein
MSARTALLYKTLIVTKCAIHSFLRQSSARRSDGAAQRHERARRAASRRRQCDTHTGDINFMHTINKARLIM